MAIDFPKLLIRDVIPRDPALAVGLTKADKNGDGVIEWEEAASVLDRPELSRYVEIALSSKPNTVRQAVALYEAQAPSIIQDLKTYGIQAANRSYSGAEAPNPSAATAWSRTNQLATDLMSLLPPDHPAHSRAEQIADQTKYLPFLDATQNQQKWSVIGGRYRPLAASLEGLKFFLET